MINISDCNFQVLPFTDYFPGNIAGYTLLTMSYDQAFETCSTVHCLAFACSTSKYTFFNLLLLLVLFLPNKLAVANSATFTDKCWFKNENHLTSGNLISSPSTRNYWYVQCD